MAMPRAKFSTTGAGCSPVRSLVSRPPSEISDTLRSSLVFPNSTNLAPSFYVCSSGAPLIPVAQQDGYRGRYQEHHHQDHYPCGGELDELGLGLLDPEEDLDRERGEVVARARGGEVYVGRGPDHDQGRRLPDGAREREYRAGQGPRERHRQEVAPDHLPPRRPEREAPLAHGIGDVLEGLARGDDDDRQDEQAEGRGAGDYALPAGYGRQQVHEYPKAQEPVDYGGHTGQVRDVYLDDAVEPGVGGVLLQVDGRAYPERHAYEPREHQEPQRADQGRVDPRRLREYLGRVAGYELPAQPWEAVPGDVHHQGDQHNEPDDRGGEDQDRERPVYRVARGGGGLEVGLRGAFTRDIGAALGHS